MHYSHRKRALLLTFQKKRAVYIFYSISPLFTRTKISFIEIGYLFELFTEEKISLDRTLKPY